MKKAFALLVLGGALSQGLAQGFIDDIDKLSRELELAKLCEALKKLGGDNPRCKAFKLPAPAGASMAAPLPIPLDLTPEVTSYTRVGDEAEVEVAYLGESRSLRVGDSIGPWRLQALTDHRATFVRGPLVRHLDFRSRPQGQPLSAGASGTPAPLRGLGQLN